MLPADFLAKYIRLTIARATRAIVTATEWNEIFNLLIAQGDYNSEALEYLMGHIGDYALDADLTSHTGNTSNPHTVTKTQLGLGNCDNTSDANKPISTAAQAALDLKANASTLTSHTGNTSNPHQVTKSQVGLSNCDNTSDVNKPVSNAQSTAIGLKVDTTTYNTHVNNVSNPHSVTKAQVGLGNCDNTADADKPVSTAMSTALGLKVDKVSGKSLIADTEITRLLGIASGAEVNVQSDWNVSDTGSDAFIKNKPTLGTAAALNVGTGANNIPQLDASGKLVVSVLPATAITETSVVASEVAMLALTAQVGDVAVRSDLNKSYILREAPASTLSNWQELLTPTDTITSVNGKTGTVSLTADDVGALDTGDIVDNLASTSTTTALSANQGKVISDLIDWASVDSTYTEDLECGTLAECLNTLVAMLGTADLDNSIFGEINDVRAAINHLLTHVAFGDGIQLQAYSEPTPYLEFTADGETWYDLTGAQGIQGKGYNPRGAWVSEGSYTNDTSVIDVVEYNGASYYCKVTHTGQTGLPTADTTNWGLLAQAGTVATGADILLTGYTLPESTTDIAATDAVNAALGKLERFCKNGAFTNPTSSNNSSLSLNATGTSIQRNVADANTALTVDQVHASSTGKIAEFKLNGTTKVSVDGESIVRTRSLRSVSDTYGIYGTLLLGSAAEQPLFQRCVDDANPALTIGNNNWTSNGSIVSFQSNATEKAKISKNGILSAAGLSSLTQDYGLINSGTQYQGPIVERNVNDALAAFTVAGMAGTGALLDLKAASTSVFKVDHYGNPVITSGNSIKDTAGNELLKVTATASAVNEITLTNAATGYAPSLAATGGDSNISINLISKGTGAVLANLYPVVTQKANVSNSQLTSTNATKVANFTPSAAGNFVVYLSLRVVTAATTITATVTYTDATGSQTNTLVNAQSTAVGTYSLVPVFINSTAAEIAVNVTAGTANQVYASASIVGV